MPSASRLTVVCAFLAATSGQAQTDAITGLRDHLTANGGHYKLKIDGVHASTDMLGRPSEVRIVDGTVSKGGIGSFMHGSDSPPIPAGTPVDVTAVETSRNAKNDFLKIRLNANGAQVPIVFVLPLRSIEGLTEVDLEKLLKPVLAANTGNATPRTSPPNRTAVIQPMDQKSPSTGPVGSENFNPATATNLSIPAVGALASRTMTVNASTRFIQPGFEGTTNSFDSRENIVTSAGITPASSIFRGIRGVRFNPGETARFLDVRALDDGEHDILHILVQTDFPFFCNISFVFPKGQLATLNESDLDRLVTPYLSLPVLRAAPSSGARSSSLQAKPISGYTYVLEGIGLGMSLEQVRAAVKTAGSIKGLVKQGPTTYNTDTKDLSFQLEFDAKGNLYQYNVGSRVRRARSSTVEPLHVALVRAFGPENSWGKPVIYDFGETGQPYAIVSDPKHFQ